MVGGAVSEDRCSDLRCGWSHLGDGVGGDVLEVRAVLEVGSDIIVLGGAVSLFGGAVAICSHPIRR